MEKISDKQSYFKIIKVLYFIDFFDFYSIRSSLNISIFFSSTNFLLCRIIILYMTLQLIFVEN